MSYQRFPIRLSPHQKKQLKKAVETSTPVRMRISASALSSGEGVPILMTSGQVKKAMKSIEQGKGMMLNMSKTQIRANKKDGGILPALIPLGVALGTALASGAASAVGTFAVNKIIDAFDGKGLSPLGTSPQNGGQFTTIPGTDLVVRNVGNGLFPHGISP